MKKIITLTLLTFLLISSAFTPATYTGNTADFDFFRTHRQGRAGITATWGFPATGATGFVVERTYDDPSDPYASWDIVAALPCTGAKSYRCTDNGVYPGFISYRVTAQLTGGGTLETPVSTVHIVSH